ncbi:polyprenol monophosphomannose synthase [Streptomyces sp. NRRL S-340]|uniref:polyprenol monophosphomannose synthase n=1 Tax=Streptomyces sp. NRRL S-340 TaxID=1463901 RepID=UPI00068E1602|nr:polyprenol monophosphomannose synthase [Streptomyces sp. NRRL S-340]
MTQPEERRAGEGGGHAVTVVMPTYNEAGNLARTAEAVLGLPLGGLRLLVVDDDSPDGTGRIADELAEKYGVDGPSGHRRMGVLHRTRKDGLGRAYTAGMTAALAEGADYVVQMDADGSHPVEAVPRMLDAALSSGAGLVVGSRYVAGGSLDERWGAHRVLLSRFANAYARAVLGTGIKDITAGFNLWSAATLRDVGLSTLDSAGYSFQVELKYRAVRAGHRAVEVPIRFGERTEGASKMTLRAQLESAVVPVRLRLKRW